MPTNDTQALLAAWTAGHQAATVPASKDAQAKAFADYLRSALDRSGDGAAALQEHINTTEKESN